MRPHCKIVWRKLASVDLATFAESISKNDEYLEEITSMVAFCSIDEEFALESVDPNLVKVFKISQQIMEFMLKEYIQLKRVADEGKHFENFKAENVKLRKLLQVHQQALGHSLTTEGTELLQCPYCPKSFYDTAFLKSHLERRHLSQPLAICEPDGVLRLSQRISDYHALCSRDQGSELIMNELKLVREKLEQTEIELRQERDERQLLNERVDHEIEARVRDAEEYPRSCFEEGLGNLTTTDSEDKDLVTEKSDRRSLEKIMLIHTKEVQKLGSNIQFLASRIAETYPTAIVANSARTVLEEREKPRQQASASGQREPGRNKIEANVHAKPTEPYADQVKLEEDEDEDTEPFTLEEVSRYTMEFLQSLGITGQTKKISEEVYSNSMKKFRKTVPRNKAIRRAIKEMVDVEMKNRIAITKPSTIAESSQSTKSSVAISNKNIFETKADVESGIVASPRPRTAHRKNGLVSNLPVARGKNELEKSEDPQTSKRNEEQASKNKNTENLTSRMAASERKQLKSVLKKEPASKNDPRAAGERRISFSDSRIEISPEASGDSDTEEIPVTGEQIEAASRTQEVGPVPKPRRTSRFEVTEIPDKMVQSSTSPTIEKSDNYSSEV